MASTRADLVQGIDHLEQAILARTSQVFDLTYGPLSVRCQVDADSADSLQPVKRLMSQLSSLPAAPPSRQVVFAAVADDGLLAAAEAVLGGDFAGLRSTSPSVPQWISTEEAGPGVCGAMRFSDGVLPYLWSIHRSRANGTLLVTREQHRRAGYTTSVMALESLMAQSDLYGLHAAAVRSDDATIVFAGPEGAGKTTLTLAAVNAGAKYVADDSVVITPEAAVLGFDYKDLSLTTRAADYARRHFTRRHGRSPALTHHGGEFHVSARSLFGPLDETRTDSTLLVLPRFEPDRSIPATAGVPADRAAALLSTDLLPWFIRREGVYGLSGKRARVEQQLRRFLSSNHVHCVQLNYGPDADAAAFAVLEIASGLPSSLLDGVGCRPNS
ncbi:hypothetical protein [Kribbella sp. CA-293567]|uniref:hypothetical protein n=1 Tax=Kribbella sp. CA-293567 TaxID=3002436 RepID=UPI0022DDAE56|nr:hypothetical protein [Kribbella sp. CA-293567]WBQ03894.1 hypothetical protein OX958_28480 [Kribbella sp. CA-293567]